MRLWHLTAVATIAALPLVGCDDYDNRSDTHRDRTPGTQPQPAPTPPSTTPPPGAAPDGTTRPDVRPEPEPEPQPTPTPPTPEPVPQSTP